jgi:predicted TIM-barrel fold metal-dependent hydrolase
MNKSFPDSVKVQKETNGLTLENGLELYDAHFHVCSFPGIFNVAGMLDASKVSKAAVLAVTVPLNWHDVPGEDLYTPDFVDRMGVDLTQNPMMMLLKALHPERIFGFGGLYHTLPGGTAKSIDFAEQAKKLIDMGFDGIKMLEGHDWARRKLPYKLDDERYFEFYKFLEDNSVPVTLHTSGPWDDPSSTQEEKEDCYRVVYNVLNKFPCLHFIFAHFLFIDFDIDRATRILDRWDTVSFDLTPHWGLYKSFMNDTESWGQFFEKYQNRIISGNKVPNSLTVITFLSNV